MFVKEKDTSTTILEHNFLEILLRGTPVTTTNCIELLVRELS